MSGIIIETEARTAEAERNLASLNQSVRNIEGTANKTAAAMSLLVKTLGAVTTAGFALNAIKNITSEFTTLENRLAQVTGRGKELQKVQSRLLDLAERTRSSYSGSVQVYASFGRALKSAGASSEKILQVTESVQKAIALSGTTAEAAAGAIIQLGQGLSAGALRGEELNSVMENTPRIAQAIADNLGISTGKMRLLAAEGKITSKQVFDALISQAKQLNKEFEVMTPTLNQASAQLTNNIKLFINNLSRGLGLTESMARVVFKMSSYMKNATANGMN